MFVKECPETTAHESHEHVHHWPKLKEEPLGWFPPGSYMETIPEEGHDGTYRCRGVEAETDNLRTIGQLV